MSALDEYLCQQLSEHLRKRRVVVWYDPRRELASYVDHLRQGEKHARCALETVRISDLGVSLCEFSGSFLEVRRCVEPCVSGDEPAHTVVYLPGVERDREGSLLMELDKAGHTWEPQLKRLARNVLRSLGRSDGAIDEMLAAEGLTYDDVQRLVEQGEGTGPSLLRVVLPEVRDNAELLALWVADSTHDSGLIAKGAQSELLALIRQRLGLSVEQDTSLDEARTQTCRYLLAGEFRLDLSCASPAALGAIPAPAAKAHEGFLRSVITELRREHPGAYEVIADRVENELGLACLGIKAEHLGSVDTFRFEEQALLGHAAGLVATGKWDKALEIVEARHRSFWADRSAPRQAQWQAVRTAAELGRRLERVAGEAARLPAKPERWVAEYAAEAGWFEADFLHRTLEALVAGAEPEADVEGAIEAVRQRYDQVTQAVAARFTEALRSAGWAVPGVLHQTHVYPDVVKATGGTTAYVIVDALRYEMGVELRNRLDGAENLSLRPATAALPTITPVGMAALLPAAAGSFTLGEAGGALIASVAGVAMKSLKERARFLAAQVPGVVELEVGQVLEMRADKLRKRVEGAPLVVVRSQQVDDLGESASTLLARQVMDTAIANVARAVRRLASAGIEYFVVTADHGHLFAVERGDDMKTDAPGGSTVALHRRCWAGRGGATPAGTVRVSAAELGYATDLDLVFPSGLGVFKAGGDLAYHHGGLSLQELVIPVLSFRMAPAAAPREGVAVSLTGVPEKVTNRTFSITLSMGSPSGDLFLPDELTVVPVLLCGDEQVGEAGMAMEAGFDRVAKSVTLRKGATALVGMLLKREDCRSLRVVVQDAKTPLVLAETAEIPVKLGI
ncbi:MAG: PglZ domain-containing protein [Thermoanaerobaculaceae bacterium]